MLGRKRRTLPKDFGDRLRTEPLDRLIAVFDRCDVDARGGYSKDTAIGMADCPDALVRWLAEHGADVDAANEYGRTPLMERAALGRVAGIPLLVGLGADLEREDGRGRTALELAATEQRSEAVRVLLQHGARLRDPAGLLLAALAGTRNIDIPDTAVLAALLLEHGAPPSEEAREEVRRIGEELEFHRAAFDPVSIAEVDAGLADLYDRFEVEPVLGRRMHDGVSPIVVPDGTWQQRTRFLWDLLVPSSGPAATVQGEAIRIAGRVQDELERNGGGNWDRDHRAMVDALTGYTGRGVALAAAQQEELTALVGAVRSGRYDPERVTRLRELVADWASQNPEPLPLAEPPYAR